MNADQLEREILKLPPERRARMAELIVASLDDESRIEVATVAAMPMENAPPVGRQWPGVAGVCRPEGLDEFIEAWKTASLDQQGAVG